MLLFFCGVVVMVPYVVRLIGVPDGKLFQSIVHLINTYVAAGGVIRAAPKSDSAHETNRSPAVPG